MRVYIYMGVFACGDLPLHTFVQITGKARVQEAVKREGGGLAFPLLSSNEALISPKMR